MPQVLKIDPQKPEPDLIGHAIRILKTGGIIAFPTETFYGLAADATNPEAVERIFRIKGRQFNNPVALIIGSEEHLDNLVEEIPDYGRLLIRAFWPGPLTLLFKSSAQIIPRLTAHSGKIGIRISSHPVAAALAIHLGGPITATSANLSGAPECCAAAEVLASLGDRVDLVIDGGATPGGKGSTLLDITADPPLCLREGTITRLNIREALNAA